MKTKNSLSEDKIKKITQFMKEHDLEGFYVSSFDENISEYVPKEDCHRYYVTGFTGSVAEVLLTLRGDDLTIRLYVDGRYHLQADKEVDSTFVTTVKCPYGQSLQEALLDDLASLKVSTLGIEGNRCPLILKESFSKLSTVQSFDQDQFKAVIEASGFQPKGQVQSLSLDLVGESTLDKCGRILSNKEAFFLQSLDSIAWITNARGFHHPYNATFIATALCTKDHVYLFTPFVELFKDISEQRKEISVHQKTEWDKVSREKLSGLEKVFYDHQSISSGHFQMLSDSFGENCLENKPFGLAPFHALKNKVELDNYEKAFKAAAQSIYQSFQDLSNLASSGDPSEEEFYNLTNQNYQKNGSTAQSFHTIAAFGAHSAIVHYGDSNQETKLKDGDFVLLDSGGFFESAMATDCTRTFVPKGTITEKHREIYTLVLKSLLRAQATTFTPGTLGSHIDQVARKPINEAGYSYSHGTGHGVGINVHESCYSLTPSSQIPLVAGLVGSIEPGIYLEDFGGVRLENIITIENHPEMPGMLRFRPLIYLGFMPNLINEEMLDPEEKIWLETYESECSKQGFSFRD